MRKLLFTLLAALTFVGCTQTKETNMDYTDDVKTALAHDGQQPDEDESK